MEEGAKGLLRRNTPIRIYLSIEKDREGQETPEAWSNNQKYD
jgi:hypothetical protein